MLTYKILHAFFKKKSLFIVFMLSSTFLSVFRNHVKSSDFSMEDRGVLSRRTEGPECSPGFTVTLFDLLSGDNRRAPEVTIPTCQYGTDFSRKILILLRYCKYFVRFLYNVQCKTLLMSRSNEVVVL